MVNLVRPETAYPNWVSAVVESMMGFLLLHVLYLLHVPKRHFCVKAVDLWVGTEAVAEVTIRRSVSGIGGEGSERGGEF